MGIGVLLVLLAFLLIAAIAAGVLISTGYNLQHTSLKTGSQAERQVTTGIELIDLSATDGTTGELDDFRYLIKLNPGASPIKLNASVLYVGTFNDTLRLLYRDGDCRRDVANGYYTIR